MSHTLILIVFSMLDTKGSNSFISSVYFLYFESYLTLINLIFSQMTYDLVYLVTLSDNIYENKP